MFELNHNDQGQPQLGDLKFTFTENDLIVIPEGFPHLAAELKMKYQVPAKIAMFAQGWLYIVPALQQVFKGQIPNLKQIGIEKVISVSGPVDQYIKDMFKYTEEETFKVSNFVDTNLFNLNIGEEEVEEVVETEDGEQGALAAPRPGPPAAQVGRARPDDRGDQGGQQRDRDGDGQRALQAVHGLGVDVVAAGGGAQRVVQRRRRGQRREVDLGVVVGGEEPADQGEQHQQAEDDQAGHRGPVAPVATPDQCGAGAPATAGRGGPGAVADRGGELGHVQAHVSPPAPSGRGRRPRRRRAWRRPPSSPHRTPPWRRRRGCRWSRWCG